MLDGRTSVEDIDAAMEVEAGGGHAPGGKGLRASWWFCAGSYNACCSFAGFDADADLDSMVTRMAQDTHKLKSLLLEGEAERAVLLNENKEYVIGHGIHSVPRVVLTPLILMPSTLLMPLSSCDCFECLQ